MGCTAFTGLCSPGHIALSGIQVRVQDVQLLLVTTQICSRTHPQTWCSQYKHAVQKHLRDLRIAKLSQAGHAGYTGAILSLFGLVGFMGLRPPGLVWMLVYALPMTLLMVGDLCIFRVKSEALPRLRTLICLQSAAECLLLLLLQLLPLLTAYYHPISELRLLGRPAQHGKMRTSELLRCLHAGSQDSQRGADPAPAFWKTVGAALQADLASASANLLAARLSCSCALSRAHA